MCSSEDYLNGCFLVVTDPEGEYENSPFFGRWAGDQSEYIRESEDQIMKVHIYFSGRGIHTVEFFTGQGSSRVVGN